MRTGEIDAVAEALGEEVVAVRPLAGGFSHETRLLSLARGDWVVAREGGGWRVTAVLDWEFSFSGCPYADAGNMMRFGGEYPADFTAGFRAGFAGSLPAGLSGAEDWDYLGAVSLACSR